MAYKRSYKRGMRKSYKSKRRTYKPRATRKKSNIKTLIRREISRNIEDKIKDTELGSMNVTQTIDDTKIQQLIPGITQGTTQSTRVGNRVKVKKFTLRLAITAYNLGATNAPSYYDIYIFKPKFQQTYAGAIPAVDMTYFLQNDSSSEAYNGQILDGLRYVNTDLFTNCFHKRITLFNPLTSQATLGATSSINPCRTFYFDLTKYVKKNLIFDDSVGSVTNDSLYIAIGSTQTNGDVIVGTVGSYMGLVQMRYEDA